MPDTTNPAEDGAVEALAKALNADEGRRDDLWRSCLGTARVGLRALHDAGYVVVPREATEWLPIKTAPKDGSLLDLWFAGPAWNRRVSDARWRGNAWYVESRGCGYYENPISITHWRRPPSSPEAERGNE